MAQQYAITEALNSETIFQRFIDKSGGDEAFARRFRSELLAIVSTNKNLAKCTTQSILTAAGQAATLKLPIAPSLGYAYVVPYKGEATFQLGYKGITQLAMRTGLYRRIRAVEVYEGELKNYNRLTGDFEFGERTGDEVVGYLAYFELLNGFQSMMYMTAEEMDQHAEKYSQSYRADKEKGWRSSVWTSNFDAMGRKTVLKLLLSKYGILSVDMQMALQADQSVIRPDGTYKYVDNERKQTIDAETGEILENEPAMADSSQTMTTAADLTLTDFA